MKLIIALLLSLISEKPLSQNVIYVGTKSYPATENWTFTNAEFVNSFDYNGATMVSVARKNTEGLLMLSTHSISDQENVSGTVIIYLENGNALSVSNRIYRDFADDQSIAIYPLSENQIASLKTSNISKIRFSLVSSFDKRGITAENRINVSKDPSQIKIDVSDTSEEIAALFSK